MLNFVKFKFCNEYACGNNLQHEIHNKSNHPMVTLVN